MAKVLVSLFKEENLSEFVELSQTEYSSLDTTDASHVRWKHIDSPYGASTYIRLIKNDKTIGRALLQPRLMYTDRGEFHSACIGDVLINSLHRSPPTNFINLTKSSANVPKFSSVYHTSNEVTEAFYQKLFRFPNPFSLKAYGFPVRLTNLFFKISGYRINCLDWLVSPFHWLNNFFVSILMRLSKLDVSERLPDDEMLSELSLKSLHNSGPFLSRSNSFLKWRLIDAPLWKAKVFCISRKGRFLGYVATRSIKLEGLRFFVVIDFLMDTEMVFFERIAFRLWLIKQTVGSGDDALFTMINPISKASRVCVGFPFTKIPDKFLPHRTPIFVRAYGDESKEVQCQKSMHMTLADLDYF